MVYLNKEPGNRLVNCFHEEFHVVGAYSGFGFCLEAEATHYIEGGELHKI